MQNMTKQAEFPYMTIFSLSNDILVLEYIENGKIGINEADDIMNTIEPFNQRGFNRILSDVSVKTFDISKEALDFIANHPNGRKYDIKNAIVANSAGIKLLAVVYINFSKPKGPSKIFQDRDEAIKWLRGQ